MAIIQPLKKLFNWQTANEKIPYNIYTALLTQSGTAAPVATVLENTIGNITWVYEGVGQYSISIPGYNKEKLIVFARLLFTYHFIWLIDTSTVIVIKCQVLSMILELELGSNC